MKKRILSIVTALALTMALLPAAAMPASAATTHTVSTSEQFHSALANARDGEVIQVSGSVVVKNPVSNNDSLVIDKAVTIQGGSLTFWYAGILLGADVTFRDITLGLGSNVRPALMANGHTLTLENVQRDPTCRNINLFCGGLTGGTQGALADAKQGGHGQIIIKGNTNLGPTGHIFAGSISTDGKDNMFTKPATVTIDSSVKGNAIGELYACGALETPTSEEDWFDYENEIAPPTPNATKFPVSGDVTFNLYHGKVEKVSGDTGTAGKYAKVTYKGTDYLNDGLVLADIGDLDMQSGNLAPASGSRFGVDDASLTIASGATLGLQNLGNVTVGNFTGGGNLVLGQSQKLTVTGAVSGATTVGIGGIFNGHSLTVPNTEGHTYIDAANSNTNSFNLATYASRPDIKLVNNGSGGWTAEADEKVIVVNDFKLASAVVEASSDPNVELPVLNFTDVQATPENNFMPLSSVKFIISVNGTETNVADDGSSYTYTTSTLDLCVTEGNNAEEALTVAGTNNTYPPVGTYVISVTVPASNSGTGQPITRTATLVVKAAGDTGDTAIPVPMANRGLVYNKKAQVGVPEGPGYTLSGDTSATEAGQHTATATLEPNFIWADNSTDPKSITWEIAKADNLDLPTGLNAAAPTTYGGSDGKITGTTAEMEYADNANFNSAKNCDNTETTGLQAGDYYVRIAESTNYKAGPAVLVTVPQGPLTVKTIVIDSSSPYKTAYTVDEPLDVNGLTLTVTMSNNSTYLVPVAAGMVSGFNSGSPIASQTLTVTYGGKKTTYTISIAENSGTDPIAVTGVALNKSNMTLTVGSSERLTATVSPGSASNKNVTWASQNPAAATVDAGGTVTAVSAGTAVITVTTVDGGKTASCTVTVSSNGGGGSSGGGGGGGSSNGDSSSSGSDTSSNTTTNADGSVTTTVTNKKTGTVTTTTRKPDGSTTVVEAKKDGTVTITDTAKNGVKVEAVSKPETDTSARVTIPAGARTTTVTVPVTVTPGTVAVDARTGEIVKLSAPTGDGMVVKLSASADLILEDRSKAFTDTDGHWAKSAIDFATAHALFSGTSDATFAPDEPMTRGMVAVVLHNFEGNPDSVAQPSFTDVASGKWYTDAIRWVTGKGIAGGYGDGSFGADDPITREQLVAFLYRYAGAMGYSTEGSADLSAFPDGANVSAYVAEAMSWAVGNGLIVGTDGGALAPGDSATRAQVAVILNRFVLNLMK